MAFLIDTNVVSEMRKGKRCAPNVAAWQLTASAQESFISAISMMEIKSGILNAKSNNAAFAQLLEEWYEFQVKPAFEGRVIAVDLEISEYCSVLLDARSRSLADALIAATAYVSDLILVTRNVTDFIDCGIELVNPWEYSAS